MIKIATSQYHPARLPNWQAYTSKIETLVSQMKAQGAQLGLLPEYAGIEIAEGGFANDEELFSNMQSKIPQYLEFYQDLAKRYQLYLQPGTVVIQSQPGLFYNRAYLFSPAGKYDYQDKLQLVEYEKSTRVLQPGSRQTLFKTPIGNIGIAICYDSEFPEIVRRLVQRGAMLILVPSYTPSLRSFHRVYYSCRARAIENQCYVMMSSAVGKVEFSDAYEQLVGQANIFSPIDVGFPEDGILCQGVMNEVQMISSSISYEKLIQVRKEGDVLNFKDAQNFDEASPSQINEVEL